MTLFGNGRAALADDGTTAEAVGWPQRRRSLRDPEVILHPRRGDATREPWIAPPGWRPRGGAAALWSRVPAAPGWTYLPGVPALPRYLRRLAAPPREGTRVGIAGLGRVGGTAATVLMSLPGTASGIGELLLHDADPANAERWLLELGAVIEFGNGAPRPALRLAGLDEIMASCDVFLFAAAAAVPPLGTAGEVRMVQLEPNRAILGDALAAAAKAGFSGLFLVVSDPVELLAQAAFKDSNGGSGGRFTGEGLAPERIGGLALGVMWARALAAARERGWEDAVRRRGAAFGPHSHEVLVFDDVQRPVPERSRVLTEAARGGNYRIRDIGFLPYVGPAVSSVALMLPRLLSGRGALASVFLDGIYFGGPARLEWGVFPSPRRLGPEVRDALSGLHGRLKAVAEAAGLAF